MPAAWPVSVPFLSEKGSYGEVGPGSNVKRTSMSVGPPKSRRRSTLSLRPLQFLTMPLDSAQSATFEAFFAATLVDGTQDFTATHPRTGVIETFKFTETYSVVPRSDELTQFSLQLIQIS